MDIATTRLDRPRGRFSENHLKCITRWEGRYGVTTKSFSIILGVKLNQIFIKKIPHTGNKASLDRFRYLHQYQKNPASKVKFDEIFFFLPGDFTPFIREGVKKQKNTESVIMIIPRRNTPSDLWKSGRTDS